jgi:gentisate 1,2-dioxygenase
MSIADLPPQRASAPRSKAESRAVYFNSGNAFMRQFPAVPDESFTAEPARALHPDTPTGLIACDRSKALECAFPATTPLILARYARIRAGEKLETEFVASGVIGYVIAGRGAVDCEGERVDWKAGDAFLLPSGVRHTYGASEDAVLWLVTNEPQLAFEKLRPGEALTEAVLFPREEIERQVDLLHQVGADAATAGLALVLSSTRQEAIRNVLPTLTVAMNSLPPGGTQRAHRHNSVAVALIVQGEGCYSMVDGRRKDWSQWATTITPPTAVHSHTNTGSRRALFFIVQDGGFYSFARASGFEARVG